MAVCFLPLFLHGQADGARDSLKKKNIQVDYADLFEYLVEGPDTYQRLIGQVELRQDSILMYCDSAIIRNETYVTAQGNVLIQQGDSLSVFADSVVYDGLTRQADLFGNVSLVNKDQKLFTDSLHYDLTTRVARYSGGATLTNDTTQLRSVSGTYLVRDRLAFFRKDVVVVNPDFSLKADTLAYLVSEGKVLFQGPTLISTREEGRIYCEDGFYDIQGKMAEFSGKAQYVAEGRQATANRIHYDGEKEAYTLEGDARVQDKETRIRSDRIVFDRRTERYETSGRSYVSDPPQLLEADQIDFDNQSESGIAFGDVIWRDTSQNLTIEADTIDYDRKRDRVRTRGARPRLITLVDGDSLFLRCDTLVSTVTVDTLGDTTRLLLAFHRVRIFKRDMQAVCDSLVYSEADSLFYFFRDPIVWADTSQFTADTVRMQLSEDRIDRIFLDNNAFIINSPDERFFNQVKGRQITAAFREQQLRTMLVEGNAESVYYAQDDQRAYIGVNKTICSEMMLFFGNNAVDQIKFFDQPKAKLTPMSQADHQSLRMPGFNWFTDRRPKNRFDL